MRFHFLFGMVLVGCAPAPTHPPVAPEPATPNAAPATAAASAAVAPTPLAFPREVCGQTVETAEADVDGILCINPSAAELRQLVGLDRLKSLALDFRASGDEPGGPSLDDLGALPALSTLEEITLMGDLTRIDGIERQPSLRKVDLALSGLTSIEPLTRVSKLRELDIQLAQFDPAPIARLRGLEVLRIVGGVGSSRPLPPLSGLTALDTLVLDQAKDARSLVGAHQIRTLELDSVSDLEPLRGLKGIETLDVVASEPARLDPIATLANLKTLTLGGKGITDLRGLAGAPQLKRVVLQDADALADLSGLERVPKLEALHIGPSEVSDLTPLAKATSLKELRIEGGNLTSLGPLHRLKSLRSVAVLAGSAPAREIKALRRALPDCEVTEAEGP